MTDAVLTEKILKRIYTIRNQKVMLDRDLAELYAVETEVLKQAVKRNRGILDDFPAISCLNSVKMSFMT